MADDWKHDPALAERVRALMAEEVGPAARALGLSRSLWHRWREQDPTFAATAAATRLAALRSTEPQVRNDG